MVPFRVHRRNGWQWLVAYCSPYSHLGFATASVQHVGISRLRALNVTQLRELDKTLVIQDNDKPLAVLLKYEHFLAMQEKILKSEE